MQKSLSILRTKEMQYIFYSRWPKECSENSIYFDTVSEYISFLWLRHWKEEMVAAHSKISVDAF